MPAFRSIFAAILFLCLFASCARSNGPQPAAQPVTITVMAAASLTNAFIEIGQMYEQQNTGSRVEFNFAGSQQLAQQLLQGAPADVFASANSAQMDVLVESGRIETAAVFPFAENRLVIIYPRDNPARLTGFEDLRKPGLKLVLAAGEVPVGRYSLEALQRASQPDAFGPSFEKEVLANVVSFEDNVRVVFTKVMLGEADAGIVYTSDVTGRSPNEIGQIPIPPAYNPTAHYPIAAIKDSQHPAQAQAFLETVLSPAGQQILEKHGFEPVAQNRR